MKKLFLTLICAASSLAAFSQMDIADGITVCHTSSTDSFNRVLKYKNYVDNYFENNVEQIMIHLVNHGSYHRGQVAMLLRQNGFEPINTDYITYDRMISGQLKD